MSHHGRKPFLCMFSALFIAAALCPIQGRYAPTAHAATKRFMGVNWTNPNDNFITSNLVPPGLSTSDTTTTTYTRATALLKSFLSLEPIRCACPSTRQPRQNRGGAVTQRPGTQPRHWDCNDGANQQWTWQQAHM